jgi:phosphoribosylformylglycinamidine synthase
MKTKKTATKTAKHKTARAAKAVSRSAKTPKPTVKSKKAPKTAAAESPRPRPASGAAVRVCLLTGFGINSDRELSASFQRAGAVVESVHLSELVSRKNPLDAFQIFAIPGGFSYGDHLGSGRVLATRLRLELGEAISAFVGKGKPVLGICNGFQVLVKAGFLPNQGGKGAQEVTLTHNDSGLFEDRWVRLGVNPKNPCIWLTGIHEFQLPVRHGEGKLVAPDDATLAALRSGQLDALRYADATGSATQEYPANPNGSSGAIAGLCDSSGLIFGLMPHPEANLIRQHEPRWRSGKLSLSGPALSKLGPDDGAGMALFYNAVAYCRKTL